MDIEKAQARLAEISVAMNAQGIPLEQSLSLYGEAVKLIRFCKDEIEKVELAVKRLEEKPAAS